MDSAMSFCFPWGGGYKYRHNSVGRCQSCVSYSEVPGPVITELRVYSSPNYPVITESWKPCSGNSGLSCWLGWGLARHQTSLPRAREQPGWRRAVEILLAIWAGWVASRISSPWKFGEGKENVLELLELCVLCNFRVEGPLEHMLFIHLTNLLSALLHTGQFNPRCRKSKWLLWGFAITSLPSLE